MIGPAVGRTTAKLPRPSGRGGVAGFALVCRGVLLVGLIAAGPASARSLAAEPANSDLAAARSAYLAGLQKSLAEAEAAGLTDRVAAVRRRLRPPPSDRIEIPRPSREVEPVPGGGDSPAERFDRADLALRRQFAAKLWEEALRAAKARSPSAAEILLLEALRADPDHAEIRAVLGHTPYRGRWRTAWEQQQIAAGRVEHPKFGWLRATHVEEYEQGRRWWSPTGSKTAGNWVSADEERRLRGMRSLPWETETEHYRVRSHVSLERAVEIAQELERLYDAWTHLFIRYWAPTQRPEDLFQKPRPVLNKSKHQVVHFADKAQYVRELANSALGDVSISTGVYFSGDETAYFFEGTEYLPITLLHEGTHQLFSEVVPRARALGKRNDFWEKRRANFWVVEGIACWMESLSFGPDAALVGGFATERFRAARYRALEEKTYLPTARLTAHNMLSLLRDPRIAPLYSQSLGLATFCMQAEGGKHREPFVDYLTAVYTGQDQPESLSRLLDRPFERLDEEYLKFLAAAPDK